MRHFFRHFHKMAFFLKFLFNAMDYFNITPVPFYIYT